MIAERIDEGLYIVKIPFEELYTTVYLVSCGEGVIIVDSATYPADAEKYIVPALAEIGESADRVKYILLTHVHADHSGGAARLAELLPWARIRAFEPMELPRFSLLSDGEILLGVLRAVLLPGHTERSGGFVDIRSSTLLSGDCLQLCGVGKYVNGVSFPELYISSVIKLSRMELKRIVAAHDYVPFGSIADGAGAVNGYLDACLRALEIKKIK